MAASAGEGSPTFSGDTESQPSAEVGNATPFPSAARGVKVKRAFSTGGKGNQSSQSLMSGVEPDAESQGRQKEVVVLAGMLLKRGGDKPDSIFRHRWVRVTNKGIGYD